MGPWPEGTDIFCIIMFFSGKMRKNRATPGAHLNNLYQNQLHGWKYD